LIARLSEPEYNLAAFGIAYSLALIIEAPVIMMMSASTALVKDYSSFRQLRKFNYILSSVLTVAMLVLIIPQIFYFIAEELIGLPRKCFTAYSFRINYFNTLARSNRIPEILSGYSYTE
jgi:progressive ankylosis protein